MSLKVLVSGGLMTVLLVGGLSFAVTDVAASHIDWDARRAEREAEREARRAEREAERAAEDAVEEEVEDAPQCRHSVSLSFAKPRIERRGDTIVMIPQVDVTIRTSGDSEAPHWQAEIDFAGTSSFESEDVTAPSGQPFAGNVLAAGGFCGTDFTRRGFPLGGFDIGTLPEGLSHDQELAGVVSLTATVNGLLESDSEHRQARFEFEGFSSPSIGGWRSVR